jgi:uncharacterized protein (DUF1330 family)
MLMSVHVIIEVKVNDKEMYGEYVKRVMPIVMRFGGRYVVRGGRITPLFGEWKPERMVVLEFETREQVHKWLDSPEYAAVKHLRENAAYTRAVIIESGPVQ